MSRDKVTRLRQLLSEAAPPTAVRSGTELEDWRRFQHFETFQAPPPLETSRRGRAMREISRIAAWYGWTNEIQRVLDAAGCLAMGGLDDEQIEQLHQRMRSLEDCVQAGLGCPDAPPAN